MKTLTVGKLIKKLQKIDQDLIVVASKDSEGNQISEITHIDADNVSFKVVDWQGFDIYLHSTVPTEDEIKEGITAVKGAKPCVVLWP